MAVTRGEGGGRARERKKTFILSCYFKSNVCAMLVYSLRRVGTKQLNRFYVSFLLLVFISFFRTLLFLSSSSSNNRPENASRINKFLRSSFNKLINGFKRRARQTASPWRSAFSSMFSLENVPRVEARDTHKAL